MMSTAHRDPLPIQIDPDFSPQFYAELWGLSPSTVLRWFQDMEGVLKLSKPSKNGKRNRASNYVFPFRWRCAFIGRKPKVG